MPNAPMPIKVHVTIHQPNFHIRLHFKFFLFLIIGSNFIRTHIIIIVFIYLVQFNIHKMIVGSSVITSPLVINPTTRPGGMCEWDMALILQ